MPDANPPPSSDAPNTRRGARPSRSPGRKPLAEGNADDTRRLLRQHALRLFSERGYASVSLDDIARAASVNRATVYYHFQNKEALFLSSVEALTQFVFVQIEKITTRQDLTVLERLALLVHERREMGEQDLSGVVDSIDDTVMHGAMPHISPPGQARLGAMLGALHGPTLALIAEGVANGQLPPLPPALLDFAFWQLFPPDGYPAELGLERAEAETLLLRWFFDRLAPN